ncbi:MAG: hypothetical protein BGO76_07195 [Caedibacter sp. 38-128]|nr:MAG: hypothetical protein BGO76_07195 [Caedibacter sp. 38-128]
MSPSFRELTPFKIKKSLIIKNTSPFYTFFTSLKHHHSGCQTLMTERSNILTISMKNFCCQYSYLRSSYLILSKKDAFV